MILRRFEIYSFADAPAAADAFARAALDCARYIPEVLHSAIGRFTGPTPLNFAWEQAYASPASYRRYMEHPYHAALLDRHLMIDSPECISTDNGLGVGLIGYRCETPVYFLPHGARRILALRLVEGAEGDFARIAADAARQGGMRVSVFRENWFGPRWFDGETIVTPDPAWTHIWEQGFDTLDAAHAYAEPWRGPADGMIEAELEIVYRIEPGYGYYDGAPCSACDSTRPSP